MIGSGSGNTRQGITQTDNDPTDQRTYVSRLQWVNKKHRQLQIHQWCLDSYILSGNAAWTHSIFHMMDSNHTALMKSQNSFQAVYMILYITVSQLGQYGLTPMYSLKSCHNPFFKSFRNIEVMRSRSTTPSYHVLKYSSSQTIKRYHMLYLNMYVLNLCLILFSSYSYDDSFPISDMMAHATDLVNMHGDVFCINDLL